MGTHPAVGNPDPLAAYKMTGTEAYGRIPVSEQTFRTLISASTPSVKLSVPLPVDPPPVDPPAALAPGPAPGLVPGPAPSPRVDPVAPTGPAPHLQVLPPQLDPSEASLALGSSIATEMDQLAEVFNGIPIEAVSKVVRNLHLRLSTIPACSSILPLPNSPQEPAQIASILSAQAPYFGTDVAAVIHNLQQWREWLIAENILTATDTLRSKYG